MSKRQSEQPGLAICLSYSYIDNKMDEMIIKLASLIEEKIFEIIQ